MKMLVNPNCRFKLERLCDSKHPEEVGGKLLGIQEGNDVIVKDVFAIPNASNSRTTRYKEYSPCQYFLPLYEKMVMLTKIGNFHSHPNGTIPSEGDMKACPGLNLWVIHHRRGEHTFTASKNYEHLEVVLLNEPHEKSVAGFRGGQFFLGDLEIDSFGRLIGNEKSLALLNLPDKTRRAYIKFLQLKDRGGYVETKQLAEALNVTVQTVRNWLKKARKLVKTEYRGFKER